MALVPHAISHFSDPYAHPKVFTEYNHYTDWYIGVVAEWQFDATSNNINIEYWRSTDGGTTWPTDSSVMDSNHQILYGNSDSYEWTQPDGP